MPDVPVLILPGAMIQLPVAERAEVAAQVADQAPDERLAGAS